MHIRSKIIIVVAVGLLSLFAHHTLEFVAQKSSENSATRVQKAILAHEDRMNSLLETISDSLETNSDIDTLALLNSVDDRDQYSIYLFEGNSLKYWHLALVPIENLTPRRLDRPIIKTENGWYFSRKRVNSEGLKIYVLFRVKSQYHYENQYLQTRFDRSLGLNNSAKISLKEEDDGRGIYDSGNRYLFTISDCERGQISHLMIIIDLIFLSVWFVSIIFAIFLIINALGRKCIRIGVTFLLLLGLYFWSLTIKLPAGISEMTLFSSQTFAYNWLLPSLAYLLEGTILLNLFCIILYRYSPLQNIDNQRVNQHYTLSLIFAFGIFLLLSFALDLIVKHSSELSFYVESLDISLPSFFKISIITLILVAFIVTLENIYINLRIKVKDFCIIVSCFTIILILLSVLFDAVNLSTVVAFAIINAIYFATKIKSHKSLRFSNFVWTLAFLALFVVARLTTLNVAKEKENRELLINNLAFNLIREDDPIAESLLQNIEKELARDTLVEKTMCDDEELDPANVIYSYLRERYFGGYFTNYDMQVVPCRGRESTIEISTSGENYNCYSYFSSMISTFGEKISPKSHFYMLNDNDGLASYFGVFTVIDRAKNSRMRLYVELNEKVSSNEIGYPELLTNARETINHQQYNGYSYAKYFDGILSSHYGPMDYPNFDDWIEKDADRFELVADNYSHLIYRAMPNQTIVLSYPEMTIQSFVAEYSFIVLSILIISTLALYLFRLNREIVFSEMTIHERIQSTFVLLIVIFFIVVCAVSAAQVISRHEFSTRRQTTTIMMSMQKFISDEIASMQSYNIDNILQRANILFGVDAHLYSPDGQLIGTSRRELFTNGIAAPQINSRAFETLKSNDGKAFLTTEKIGQMTHYSIYAPLFSEDGEEVAWIDIPFFNDIKAIRNQLIFTFLPLTNSYMLIILMAIFLSYFLTRGITRPLISISESLHKVQLQKKNEKISYPNKDEIGLLVNEYNRMIDELSRSAEILATSERHSTWTQMARQIAHEIKNPLTPMKLNVQFLLRAWNEKREDFEELLKRTTTSLTEQIDNLAFIAGKFSDLAKENDEKVVSRIDVCERLENAIALFANTEDVTISLEKMIDSAHTMINGDELTSVFNNLIKNATQAGKNGEEIRIDAKIEVEQERILITISDNGRGIEPEIREKIFRPNFTTKSNGMGLGLAICKEIIVASGGEIFFETELNVGTKFHIILPLC